MNEAILDLSVGLIFALIVILKLHLIMRDRRESWELAAKAIYDLAQLASEHNDRLDSLEEDADEFWEKRCCGECAREKAPHE